MSRSRSVNTAVGCRWRPTIYEAGRAGSVRACGAPKWTEHVFQFILVCDCRRKLQQFEVTPSRPVPLRVQAEECEPLKFERYELQPVTSSPDQGRWTEHEDVGETPSRRDEMRSLAASTGSSGDHGGEKSEEDPDEEHPTQTDEGQALGTQRLGHCGPEGLHIENADAGAVSKL